MLPTPLRLRPPAPTRVVHSSSLGPQVPYAPDYRHRVARVALVCIAAGHLRSTLRLAVRERHAAAETTEHTPYHAQRVTCAFNATLPAYSGSTREHRTSSLCSPGPRLAAGLCVQGKARPGPRGALASPSTAPPLSSDCARCFSPWQTSAPGASSRQRTRHDRAVRWPSQTHRHTRRPPRVRTRAG